MRKCLLFINISLCLAFASGASTRPRELEELKESSELTKCSGLKELDKSGEESAQNGIEVMISREAIALERTLPLPEQVEVSYLLFNIYNDERCTCEFDISMPLWLIQYLNLTPLMQEAEVIELSTELTL